MYIIYNERLSNFSQFISVKVKKNLRKSENQFREKLRKLRLRQNDSFLIEKNVCLNWSIYNLCQKSWNTFIISAAHLEVSLSPPQNNIVIYSVQRYRKSRYACRPFSDKYTLNPTLFLGEGDFHRSTWIRKSFLSEIMH